MVVLKFTTMKLSKSLVKIFNAILIIVIVNSCTEEFTEQVVDSNNWKISIKSDSIENISGSSATAKGIIDSVNSYQIVSRGICFDTIPNPTTNKSKIENGSGQGKFTCTLSGLMPQKKYYARAYASTGYMDFYGEERSFTTKDGLPSLNSIKITDITQTSVIASSELTDDGGFSITALGICYSKDPSPTQDMNKILADSLSGEFSKQISNLTYNTIYYFRAFAANNQGITYSIQDTVLTSPGVPVVKTNPFEEINSISARGSVEVTDDGGYPVTQAGICYSKNENPTLDDYTYDYTDPATITSFSISISDLEPDSKYYYRAYANNKIGTGYGDIKSFTTRNGLIIPYIMSLSQISENAATLIIDFQGAIDIPSCELGIYWSKTSNPDEYDSVYVIPNASSLGTQPVNLDGLEPNTRYFYRAFATTSYGQNVSAISSFYTNDKNAPELAFVTVDGGPFMMGSESGDIDERPVHQVQVSSFQMSTTEVTINQYLKFLETLQSEGKDLVALDFVFWGEICPIKSYSYYDSLYFSCSDLSPSPNCPVMFITKKGAIAYCEWAGGRLPTEAEWEFAARGGNFSQNYTYSGSNTLDDVGWYVDNANSSLHPVGTKLPNELGLYDMTGNVLEFCSDDYFDAYYTNSPEIDPVCDMGENWSYENIRGGGWDSNDPLSLRITKRYSFSWSASSDLGFRVVKDLNK